MISNRTRANVAWIMTLVRKDWDWPVYYDGDNRTGKTDLATQVLLLAEPELARSVLTEEYGDVLDRVAWDLDTFVRKAESLPPGSALLHDEARLLGRRAMSEYNLRMLDVMSTIANLNLLLEHTFTDFWMIDPYLRDSRVRTRGYVSSVRGERGYVKWYVRKRYPFPRPGGGVVWWAPAYSERFTPLKSDGPEAAELWARLGDRAAAAKKLIRSDAADPRREIARNLKRSMPRLTVREIAKLVGRGPTWVSDAVRDVSPAEERVPPTDGSLSVPDPEGGNEPPLAPV